MDELFTRLFPKLARRYGDDAAQQAFFGYWKRLQDGAVILKAESYITRSAHIWHIRARIHPMAPANTIPVEPHTISTQPTQLRRAEARQIIEHADPVLIRTAFEGRASNGTGKSREATSTLRSKRYRAREKLKRVLWC